MPTKPFSLRIDDEIRERLKQQALRLHRSESFVATAAITSYLESCDRKQAAIDAAVAEANEGSFISSDAMNKWVDSWGDIKEKSLPEIDIHK